MAVKEERRVEEEEVGEMAEPVSPTGQYFNSSALSVSVLAVFESEIPIDDSPTMYMLTNVFLPINPRFSSIMVKDENGARHWKRVNIRLEDHVKIPVFPASLPPESYDVYFQEYVSKIAMEQLPQSRPLWDIHIIKYPMSNAAGAVIIKLHHSMGDGFSLMGALFSCIKRADDPSLPLTFPSQPKPLQEQDWAGICRNIPRYLSALYNTASDFAFSLLKSNLVEDDKTPVRSATAGVEFRPITISTVTFSLDHIKQVKSKLGATINDVITGIVFYSVHLYMQDAGQSVPDTARVTSLVLLNTRIISQYQSVKEMNQPNAESPWGNQFGFLHVSVPHCSKKDEKQPLEFVFKAKEVIQRKRASLAVYLTGQLLEMIRKIKGPEVTAQYIHATLKNTSMTISNLIGPMEQMSIADHPIRGLYFMVVGVPQSLTITMVSYNGQLTVALGTEKGYINSQLLSSCMERAFDTIFEAAMGRPGIHST
ncbi:wax ester synthase/diacylglycerol acyltransferase 4-like [Magnolia sinica]|uniref:wax ester synthase/diacylglycerol acyltransferase 4-like n=1 Tax=Magnolia sinica TaxID=86752 RepID=UPI00265857B7|nr:wax ester synthase/diacylglycerol acyltransferase 4-like [Magnolia sinica]